MSREIPLTQGKVAIVDDADFDWLNQWKWHFANSGYAMRTAGGRVNKHNVLMHRLVIAAPDGMYVDHIDSNRLNNQRSNLRVVTKLQNNQHVKQRNGYTSQYKGVHYDARSRKWVAEITSNGKRFLLGSFRSEIEAAKSYNDASTLLHGEFCLLNDLSNHIETPAIIKPPPPKTSAYRGVYFAKDRGKWRAVITLGGKKINLGSFSTEEEAAAAYERASMSPR